MVENPWHAAPRYHCAMPAFSYQALDADGKTRTGVVEADAAKSARSLLYGPASWQGWYLPACPWNVP
jgi:hypothetical protein